MLHLSLSGATLTPQSHLSNGLGRTFDLNLNPAVAEIADPSVQPQFRGPSVAAVAEANALNASFNQKSPALLQIPARRPFASGTTPVQVVTLLGILTASRAARHRQQIVEQLAQWRCAQLAWIV